MVIVGPLSGVLVDRWRRQRLISWTDIIGGLLVLAAALLFLFAPSRTALLVTVVFAVALATGLLDTISQPAIGACLPDIVPKEKLEPANSLNMAGMQIAVFVAQGSAGGALRSRRHAFARAGKCRDLPLGRRQRAFHADPAPSAARSRPPAPRRAVPQ
jgi:MFS family permease